MRGRLVPKIFSSLLSFAFLVTNVVWAHQPQLDMWARRIPVAPLSSLRPSLPASALPSKKSSATLIEALSGPFGNVRHPSALGKKTVIHIQDVHMHAEAQRNIRFVVQRLIDEKKVDLIALEGAFGSIDFTPFRTYRYQASVKAVADYLLKEKKISGAVYTGFTSAAMIPPFVGVDDRALYDANVDAYKKSAPLIKKLKKKLSAERSALDKSKLESFNSRLRQLDQLAQRYHRGELDWGRYVEKLASQTDDVPMPVSIFLEALTLERKLNFSQVERERTRFVSDLVSRLASHESEKLIELSERYRLGEIGHGSLMRELRAMGTKKNIDTSRYPAFHSYIQYVLLSDSLDVEKTHHAVSEMETALAQKWTMNDQERVLLQQSGQLFLAEKLLNFSLSRDEWKNYEKGKRADFDSFERFYEYALSRDEAMAQNLLNAIKNTKANTVALVTGGFHTEGIRRSLDQAGISTITFVPKISKVNEQGNDYLSVFTRERTPLDKLFAGEKLFVPPPVMVNPGPAEVMAAAHTLGTVPDVSLENIQKSPLQIPSDAVANVDADKQQVTIKAYGVRHQTVINSQTDEIENSTARPMWSDFFRQWLRNVHLVIAEEAPKVNTKPDEKAVFVRTAVEMDLREIANVFGNELSMSDVEKMHFNPLKFDLILIKNGRLIGYISGDYEESEHHKDIVIQKIFVHPSFDHEKALIAFIDELNFHLESSSRLRFLKVRVHEMDVRSQLFWRDQGFQGQINPDYPDLIEFQSFPKTDAYFKRRVDYMNKSDRPAIADLGVLQGYGIDEIHHAAMKPERKLKPRVRLAYVIRMGSRIIAAAKMGTMLQHGIFHQLLVDPEFAPFYSNIIRTLTLQFKVDAPYVMKGMFFPVSVLNRELNSVLFDITGGNVRFDAHKDPMGQLVYTIPINAAPSSDPSAKFSDDDINAIIPVILKMKQAQQILRGPDLDHLARLFKGGDLKMLLAGHGNQIVGYLLFSEKEKYVRLEDYDAITPELEQALVEQFVNQEKTRPVHMWVHESDFSAINLLERYQFSEQADRRSPSRFNDHKFMMRQADSAGAELHSPQLLLALGFLPSDSFWPALIVGALFLSSLAFAQQRWKKGIKGRKDPPVSSAVVVVDPEPVYLWLASQEKIEFELLEMSRTHPMPNNQVACKTIAKKLYSTLSTKPLFTRNDVHEFLSDKQYLGPVRTPAFLNRFLWDDRDYALAIAQRNTEPTYEALLARAPHHDPTGIAYSFHIDGSDIEIMEPELWKFIEHSIAGGARHIRLFYEGAIGLEFANKLIHRHFGSVSPGAELRNKLIEFNITNGIEVEVLDAFLHRWINLTKDLPMRLNQAIPYVENISQGRDWMQFLYFLQNDPLAAAGAKTFLRIVNSPVFAEQRKSLLNRPYERQIVALKSKIESTYPGVFVSMESEPLDPKWGEENRNFWIFEIKTSQVTFAALIGQWEKARIIYENSIDYLWESLKIRWQSLHEQVNTQPNPSVKTATLVFRGSGHAGEERKFWETPGAHSNLITFSPTAGFSQPDSIVVQARNEGRANINEGAAEEAGYGVLYYSLIGGVKMKIANQAVEQFPSYPLPHDEQISILMDRIIYGKELYSGRPGVSSLLSEEELTELSKALTDPLGPDIPFDYIRAFDRFRSHLKKMKDSKGQSRWLPDYDHFMENPYLATMRINRASHLWHYRPNQPEPHYDAGAALVIASLLGISWMPIALWIAIPVLVYFFIIRPFVLPWVLTKLGKLIVEIQHEKMGKNDRVKPIRGQTVKPKFVDKRRLNGTMPVSQFDIMKRRTKLFWRATKPKMTLAMNKISAFPKWLVTDGILWMIEHVLLFPTLFLTLRLIFSGPKQIAPVNKNDLGVVRSPSSDNFLNETIHHFDPLFIWMHPVRSIPHQAFGQMIIWSLAVSFLFHFEAVAVAAVWMGESVGIWAWLRMIFLFWTGGFIGHGVYKIVAQHFAWAPLSLQPSNPTDKATTQVIQNIQLRQGPLSFDLANMAITHGVDRRFDTMFDAVRAAFGMARDVVTIIHVSRIEDLSNAHAAVYQAHDQKRRNDGSISAIVIILDADAKPGLKTDVMMSMSPWMGRTPIHIINEKEFISPNKVVSFAAVFEFLSDYSDAGSNERVWQVYRQLAKDDVTDKKVVVIGNSKTPYEISMNLRSILIYLVRMKDFILMLEIEAVAAAARMA